MKLAEALTMVQSIPPHAPPLEVALRCGFTPLHLETFLRAQLCRLFPGRFLRAQLGRYGDLLGNLKRPAAPGCRLLRSQFAETCPTLHHPVEELPNG